MKKTLRHCKKEYGWLGDWEHYPLYLMREFPGKVEFRLYPYAVRKTDNFDLGFRSVDLVFDWLNGQLASPSIEIYNFHGTLYVHSLAEYAKLAGKLSLDLTEAEEHRRMTTSESVEGWLEEVGFKEMQSLFAGSYVPSVHGNRTRFIVKEREGSSHAVWHLWVNDEAEIPVRIEDMGFDPMNYSWEENMRRT